MSGEICLMTPKPSDLAFLSVILKLCSPISAFI
ncbi:hypothetical protein M080_4380, partial [Bacteroides fragilis str. 3397 T10]